MTLKCPECLSPAEKTDRFCRNCGTSLLSTPIERSILTGRESINIGVGDLRDVSINIDTQISRLKGEPQALIGRTSARRLILKSSWLVISGLIGFLGSVASIIGLFMGFDTPLRLTDPLWFLVSGISMIALFLGIYLRRFRFIHLGLLSLNLEGAKDGTLFITRVGGNCPTCGSKLSLLNVGPKNRQTTIVACNRNPSQHRWGFDPTILPDL